MKSTGCLKKIQLIVIEKCCNFFFYATTDDKVIFIWIIYPKENVSGVSQTT